MAKKRQFSLIRFAMAKHTFYQKEGEVFLEVLYAYGGFRVAKIRRTHFTKMKPINYRPVWRYRNNWHWRAYEKQGDILHKNLCSYQENYWKYKNKEKS